MICSGKFVSFYISYAFFFLSFNANANANANVGCFDSFVKDNKITKKRLASSRNVAHLILDDHLNFHFLVLSGQLPFVKKHSKSVIKQKHKFLRSKSDVIAYLKHRANEYGVSFKRYTPGSKKNSGDFVAEVSGKSKYPKTIQLFVDFNFIENDSKTTNIPDIAAALELMRVFAQIGSDETIQFVFTSSQQEDIENSLVIKELKNKRSNNQMAIFIKGIAYSPLDHVDQGPFPLYIQGGGKQRFATENGYKSTVNLIEKLIFQASRYDGRSTDLRVLRDDSKSYLHQKLWEADVPAVYISPSDINSGINQAKWKKDLPINWYFYSSNVGLIGEFIGLLSGPILSKKNIHPRLLKVDKSLAKRDDEIFRQLFNAEVLEYGLARVKLRHKLEDDELEDDELEDDELEDDDHVFGISPKRTYADRQERLNFQLYLLRLKESKANKDEQGDKE